MPAFLSDTPTHRANRSRCGRRCSCLFCLRRWHNRAGTSALDIFPSPFFFLPLTCYTRNTTPAKHNRYLFLHWQAIKISSRNPFFYPQTLNTTPKTDVACANLHRPFKPPPNAYRGQKSLFPPCRGLAPRRSVFAAAVMNRGKPSLRLWPHLVRVPFSGRQPLPPSARNGSFVLFR